MGNTNPTPFTGKDGTQYVAVLAGIDGSGNADALKTNGSGVLLTSVSGAGSGGTSATDDAAFTPGTDAGTPMMGYAGSDTVDSGDAGVVKIDTSRRLLVAIDADNVGIGGGTQYTEDAAAAANPVGNALIGIRADTLAGVTSTDGDNVAARMTDRGELYVKHADAIPVTDNGGTLTVDGTVTANIGTVGTLATAAKQDTGNTSLATIAGAVSGTEVQVDVLTMPTVAVTNAALTELAAAINSDKVDVNIVSGSASGTEYTEDAAAAGNPAGPMTMAVRADSLAGVTSTDGDNIAARATDKGELYVKHVDSIPVTGTFYQATQPVSAASLPLPTGASTSANQTTIIGHLDGVESTLTNIDTNTGTIIGELQTISGAVAGTEMQVDVVSSALPTGAATSAKQDTIITAVQLLDDSVQVLGTDTYTEASSKGITLGAVRRDADTTLVNTTNEFAPLQVDANGRLKVEAFSGEALPVTDNGSTLSVDDGAGSITVDYATTGSGTATGALRVELPTNGTGVIATVGAVTAITNALPAGTNAIGKLAANSGVDIGDVDVTSVNGFAAHDAAIAGNPLIIGGVSSAAAPTSVSADQEAVRAWYLRNGAAATVLTAAGALIGGDATNGLDVDVTRLPALAAGTNNIGDVDVLTVNGVAPAFGSGVRGATVQRVTIATDDVVPASQSGTWTVQPGNTANTTPWLVSTRSATAGGATPSMTISAASTNATSVKGSAATLYGVQVYNTNAAARYLKLYNKASAPTVGTDTPVKVITIPGATTGAGSNITIPACGIAFGTGLAFALTTGVANSDTGAVAANEIVVNLDYA